MGEATGEEDEGQQDQRDGDERRDIEPVSDSETGVELVCVDPALLIAGKTALEVWRWIPADSTWYPTVGR